MLIYVHLEEGGKNKLAFYSTITELINSIKGEEISYRNLHTQIFIDSKGEVIKIPYASLVRNYLPYFQNTVLTAQFTDREVDMYRFRPKRLSYDLYGTTELWSALLELNGLYSTLDFKLDKPKVFEPREFLKLLNEAMILEGIIQ